MIVNLCLACQHVNERNAKRCVVCGHDLRVRDTQPAPLSSSLDRNSSPGALWLDLGEPPREPRPAEAPDAPPLVITLRDIQQPPAADMVDVAPAAEVMLLSDPEPQPPMAFDASIEGNASASPLADAASRAEQKAARRAKVRRARLRGASTAEPTSQVTPDVLLLDSDIAARDQLHNLLRGFGFGVVLATDAADACALVVSWPFVAAFIDIASKAEEDGDGIDLCKQVRTLSTRHGDPSAALVLVLVGGQLSPVDRVRARLAGCDEAILKPFTRGSVASVLDARGVALPSDARHL